MTEADALLEVAEAIRLAAYALASISTALCLMLFFKDMSAGSAIRKIADQIGVIASHLDRSK